MKNNACDFELHKFIVRSFSSCKTDLSNCEAVQMKVIGFFLTLPTLNSIHSSVRTLTSWISPWTQILSNAKNLQPLLQRAAILSISSPNCLVQVCQCIIWGMAIYAILRQYLSLEKLWEIFASTFKITCQQFLGDPTQTNQSPVFGFRLAQKMPNWHLVLWYLIHGKNFKYYTVFINRSRFVTG